MKNKVVFVVVLILACLSSCIGPKQTNLLQDIKENFPNDDVAPVDYRIIQGDQLILTIYTLDESMKELFSAFMQNNNNNFNPQEQTSLGGREATPFNVLSVSSTGNIKIPYVGDVNVLNMTILDAKRVISDKFKSFAPNVSVDLNLRNRYFFVLGEFGSRSIKMPHLRMNIFQALAQSGNIGLYADRKKVKIIRQTATGTEVKIFDIRSKDIVNSDYYYIQPNDVIYAPQLQRKFIGGITSFTGIFGFIMTLAGTAFGIWALVDKLK